MISGKGALYGADDGHGADAEKKRCREESIFDFSTVVAVHHGLNLFCEKLQFLLNIYDFSKEGAKSHGQDDDHGVLHLHKASDPKVNHCESQYFKQTVGNVLIDYFMEYNPHDTAKENGKSINNSSEQFIHLFFSLETADNKRHTPS